MCIYKSPYYSLLVYNIIGHKLTELYIRRNQLSDFSELDHLTALPNLTVSV
jgi:Leucine-rich repeat (LRR) protein